MRKLIAGMKISADGVVGGPDGTGAPWVSAWSEDYGLTPQIDACVLGGGMYPGRAREPGLRRRLTQTQAGSTTCGGQPCRVGR